MSERNEHNMPVRTKPVRIFEADAGALRLIAGLEGRNAAQVVHAALAEYMNHHRDRLADVISSAQRAFATGDTTSLAQAMSLSAQQRVDELVRSVEDAR
jgi:hypothetical protein